MGDQALNTQPNLEASLVFPIARVKRAAKFDPEVKALSKESAVALTKATELFIGYLAIKSYSNSALRGGKNIKDYDVFHAVHTNDTFEFLREDFPKKQIPIKKLQPKKQVTPIEPKPVIQNYFVQNKAQKISTTESHVEEESTMTRDKYPIKEYDEDQVVSIDDATEELIQQRNSDE